MVFSHIRPCALIELAVVLLQVVGVVGLCLSRLMPLTRWAEHGRVGFVISLVGLGVAGAYCGMHDSEFGLFAGGTMTALLIGMTIGSSPADMTAPQRLLMSVEATLAN